MAVLFGGPSAEREVSMWSGTRVVGALDPARYEALPVEITHDGKWLPRPDLLALPGPGAVGSPAAGHSGAGAARPSTAARPDPAGEGASAGTSLATVAPRHIDEVITGGTVDVAFIALHGPYGEDGTVQGLLELLGVPYTGSGVLASALAMDKLRSRQVLQASGVPVPAYVVIDGGEWPRGREAAAARIAKDLGYPCVVKPNALGSSIGVHIVRDEAALDGAVEDALAHGPVVLVEEHLHGVELTCAILEDPATGAPRALPVVEIVPKREFFTYEAKYQPGASEEICPARIPAELARKAADLAVRSHAVLGCEGFSRVDLFLCGTDVVVLEVNTIPGLAEVSLLPVAARAAGIEFPELVNRVIACAMRRARTARRGAGRSPGAPER